MAIARFSAALRRAFAQGAGFGVARRLFRGVAAPSIFRWLGGAFGTMLQRELDTIFEHGRQMRFAGDQLSALSPGGVLSLSDIPVNPWLGPNIAEGSRVVSELILPWQNTGTGQEGEWYHRFRFADTISIDEINGSIESWIAGITADPGSPPLGDITQAQFIVGSFAGVGIVRLY